MIRPLNKSLLGSVVLAAIASASFAVEPVAKDAPKPIAVSVERAFPNLTVDRPVVVTHAGDQSNRVFVAGQRGTIYVLPSDESAEEASVFLDIEDRVTYKDEENEEGLLGLVFHPKFKENGEFFVYYTAKKEAHLSTVSRFRVSKSDPSKADPASEEILMTIKQPFWNHNGGTLVFGPDGYLYIGLGDGGKGGDPLMSGQDLSTWLGKILRIDVDHKDSGLPYAIPKDNPFVNKSGARPEIYALGLRNIWRMSFDRKTGDFWVADVGQNLYEEINLVTAGGNYGWSIREAGHPFDRSNPDNRLEDSAKKPKPANLIDPVFEYPHDNNWGKSITGGVVYRGSKVPSLQGYYLYGDYVSGKLWALKYDGKSKKVVENRVIAWPPSLPIVTYGEDESGEVYFTTVTSGGRLYRFVEGSK